jgi:N-acetylglucosamine-6-phosphate deacetylase
MDQFLKWQELSGNKIRTITMAPEHDRDGSFIGTLKEQGVTVSAGHTAVGFAGIKKAVEQGVSQLTHLCNAMNGIHHRDIGAVGAAFLLDSLRAELIADGIHVAKEMLQLIYDNVGSDRIILITDSMRAKGLPPGDYELGQQPVKVDGERAVLEDGTLAGSILKMDDGARRIVWAKWCVLV